MGRAPRKLLDGCSFPITLRCNSRAFLIARGVRRDLRLAEREPQQHWSEQLPDWSDWTA